MLLGLAGGGKAGTGVATPPTLVSAIVPADGLTLALTFFAPVSPMLPASAVAGLTVTVAGSGATFTSATSGVVITLTMTTTIYVGQVVTIAYTAGDITDSAPTSLGNFGATSVTNNSTATVPTFSSTKCLSFDGVDELAAAADSNAQDFTTAMTMSFWVKATGNGSYKSIVMKMDTGSAPERGYAALDSGAVANRIAVQIYQSGGGTQKIYSCSSAMLDGTWHHFVFTFGSSTLKLYQDRVLDASPTKTNDGAVSSLNVNTTGLRVGCQSTSGSNTGFWAGKLSNLSLWNVELDQTAITALATGGKPADLSAHANFASCKGWYYLGDFDTIGAAGILDHSGNNIHMSPTNMEAGDIVTDAP